MGPARLLRLAWARMRATATSFLTLSCVLGATAGPARADDEEASDGMAGRHRIELELAGGACWVSDDPDHLDVGIGGQLSARAMLDLTHVRADASFLLLDPTRPEFFQLRGDARLLFVVVHDFTWRRTEAGELIRLLGGLGGEIDLPDDVSHLMLDVGFAMARMGKFDEVACQSSESYDAYAGVTARVHFWEVRDELRIAVHGMTEPPELSLDVGAMFDGFQAGFTASNRLYVQALREGVVSLGPQLDVEVETLRQGVVVVASLGIAGTLGI